MNTRVNLKFSHDRFLSFRKTNHGPDIEIIRTDRQIFRDMKGSVVPYFSGRTKMTFWVRDLVMAVGAFSLAKLSEEKEPHNYI